MTKKRNSGWRKAEEHLEQKRTRRRRDRGQKIGMKRKYGRKGT